MGSILGMSISGITGFLLVRYRLPLIKQPTLYRSDPDVEVLAFPHLCPYGRGQWVEGTRTEQGRLQYTRHMDVKNKLSSVSSAFRDDWYWPSWAYQEIEATRIFQN